MPSDMGPDRERKEQYHNTRLASGYKEPVGIMKELDTNQMNYASHREDKSFRNMDLVVDNNMYEGMKSGNYKQVEGEKCDLDLTESSSSFDSDGEYDPDLYDDALSASPSDRYRKRSQTRKKLTSSWKKYVGPLRWRCKWVELQIKKCKLQAQKYEREIAEYNRREECRISKSGNVNSESLPFSEQSLKKEVFKRKHRRRVEDTEGVSSYMSQHNLFSYFENQKSTVVDAAGTDGKGKQGANVTSETGINEELITHELNDESNSLEQIFWKMGVIQWQVNEMKTRVCKVLDENGLSLFVSSDNSLASSAENPASPLENKGQTVNLAPPISDEIVCDNNDTKMLDVAVPESKALVCGKVKHELDDIKSINPLTMGGSSEISTGTIVTYNRRAKKNPNNSKEANIVPKLEPQESAEDHQGSSSSISSPNIRSLSEMLMSSANETSGFKRKRATRKAGSGKWNQ